MNDKTSSHYDNAAQIIALREIVDYLDGAQTALLDAGANLVCARAFLEDPVDSSILGGVAYDLEGVARRLEPVRHRVRAELDALTGGQDSDKASTTGGEIIGCGWRSRRR